MEKLAKIQRELKAPKDMKNSFGGYNYRSAESILEAVKPLLDGAILTLSDEIVMLGNPDTEDSKCRFYIKATATFQDGEFVKTTTAYAREPESKKGMDDSQITGTASSYARKYALNGLFCIDDNKDADTDEYQEQTKSAPARKQTLDHTPTVEEIIKSIEESMTLDNCKKFYARAIELYGKDTPDYKVWVKVWADKKDDLEKAQTKADLDADFAALQDKIGF